MYLLIMYKIKTKLKRLQKQYLYAFIYFIACVVSIVCWLKWSSPSFLVPDHQHFTITYSMERGFKIWSELGEGERTFLFTTKQSLHRFPNCTSYVSTWFILINRFCIHPNLQVVLYACSLFRNVLNDYMHQMPTARQSHLRPAPLCILYIYKQSTHFR